MTTSTPTEDSPPVHPTGDRPDDGHAWDPFGGEASWDITDDGRAWSRPRPGRRPRRPRRHRLLTGVLRGAGGLVVVVMLLALAAYYLPIPMLDAYLNDKVTGEIAAHLSCPGGPATAPQVKLGPGRVLPQLLHDRLNQVHLLVPDVAVGGAKHAQVEAALTGLTGLRDSRQRVDRIESSTTIKFADMPPPLTGPRPTYGYAGGALSLTVPMTHGLSKGVTSTLFLRLALRGESVIATPEKLLLFNKVIAASKVSAVTGGVRITQLPHLPAGLHYTSVSVGRDGVHVGLSGVVVTPLSSLPPVAGGKKVTYSVRNGQLGISSVAINLWPILRESVTIWVTPQLQGNQLVMVPQSVTALGKDRPTSDWIASFVLKQVDPASLVTQLPALPSGVSYRSASVDAEGVKVVVGGVTVNPFSKMPPSGNGLPTRYGAQDGYLTVTTTGMPDTGKQSSIVLYSIPKITGTTMDVSPQQIEILGSLFPAADVLSQIGAQNTSYQLDPLPAGMGYTGVQVLPQGIRVLVSGQNVVLGRGLPGQKC